MNLEINLVKIDQLVGSNSGSLLERRRYTADNDVEVLAHTVDFIKECMDIMVGAITNNVLVENLRSLKNITIQELSELNQILRISAGLNIWVYYVADLEVNGSGIGSDSLEYNIIDNVMRIQSFPFCTKKVYSKNAVSLTGLYKTIIDIYGLYKESKFTGVGNPLQSYLSSIEKDEQLVGVTSKTKLTVLNSMIDELGKSIKIITA